MPPALDFPASPTVGQKYPSPSVTGVPVYTWDGEKWTTLGGAIGSTGASDVIPQPDTGTGAAGSSTLWSRGDHAHPSDPTRAPINNPVFTGDPKAPTPTAGDNDTSVATTAFVTAAVVNSAGTIPTTYVRYDQPQTLTAPQLIQARQNIYAAPFDAMAYSGLQINGGMEVSQERGFGSLSNSIGYVCDGWRSGYSGTVIVASAAYLSAGFAGFPNFLGLAPTTAQASLGAGDYAITTQGIEGYRIARLSWGTVNAQPITIGFWTSHHRPGLYSGSVRNSVSGVPNRSYVFTYTQTAADTPQYNTVTIPGDTAGTWATDNTIGMLITFSMGSGSTWTAPSANAWTAGSYQAAPGQINAVAATTDFFRLTGVIVLPGTEAPSAARSPFVMRSYDQELVLCQRYYEVEVFPPSFGQLLPAALNGSNYYAEWRFHAKKRATPTFALASGAIWNVGTPTIAPGVDGVLFYVGGNFPFVVTGTTGTNGLTADARL